MPLTDADLTAIREYLSARAEVTPEFDGISFDTIHDIDLGRRGHVRLNASAIEALLAEISRLRAKETESEWEYGVQHLEAPGFSFDSGFFPECAEHGCYRVRRHPATEWEQVEAGESDD